VIHFNSPRRLAALVLLAATGWSASRGPDAAGYVITDTSSYSFFDISGTGVRILAGTDDDSLPVAVGFPFRFYDQSYASACVSTNGMIAFGGCNPDFANQDFTANAPGKDLPTVAPYWDDLTFATAGADAVYYQTVGVAPARRFVVQWNNAFRLNGTRGITFEAVLYEATNRIQFYYRSLGTGGAAGEDQGGRATVGVRDAAGQSNGRRVQWSYRSPVLQNSSALLITSAAAAQSALNAASLAAGPVAANTILSLFGANLACSSGLQVLVNGAPAEVLYAGAAQINFVSPGNLAGESAAIQALCGSTDLGQISLDTAAAAPALFTASSTGAGQASVLNQDMSVNGPARPAAPGSYVAAYGTGFGGVNAPGADGLSWLSQTVTATVGGLPAKVTYAGLAPGMTPGLQQINVKLPDNCPTGDAIAIQLTVAGTATQKGATIAVR
jgi:uncharacterized protein (TIGR03437 family)